VRTWDVIGLLLGVVITLGAIREDITTLCGSVCHVSMLQQAQKVGILCAINPDTQPTAKPQCPHAVWLRMRVLILCLTVGYLNSQLLCSGQGQRTIDLTQIGVKI